MLDQTKVIDEFKDFHRNCVIDKMRVNADTFRFICQITGEYINIQMPYVTCDGNLSCAIRGYCTREHACND